MDQTLALIGRAHQGDKAARDLLFEQNTGLIRSVAKRFWGRGVEPEDLFQIGSIGLLKAVDNFNLDYNVKFSTYAVPMIIGEIRRFLRDDGMLKVSRSLREKQVRLFRMREELESELGREPTVGELSARTGLPADELAAAAEAGNEVESLQRTVYADGGTEIMLMDKIPEREDRHGKLLDRIFLEDILSRLEPEERRLIGMRYFQDMTQTEIARNLGVSQVQVSRMEKRILTRMRDRIE